MASESRVIPGIVHNGVVVPEAGPPLPEGERVSILIGSAEMPAELQKELRAWEKVGDEAWAMIDEWEREQQP